MKLEVGDYVRTKNNGVCKLYREFHEDSVDVGICVFHEIDGFFIDKEEINYIEKDDILKSSKNIIDLIEEGDYVNGNKVIRIETSSYPEDKNVKIIVCCGDNDYYVYYNEDIKSILTKEQFESMAYEVEQSPKKKRQ